MQVRAPSPAVDPAVDPFGHAVEPLGILQLGQIEPELGPLLARRQVVARERIDMTGFLPLPPSYSAASADFAARAFNASRAITIFCTSVAPS